MLEQIKISGKCPEAIFIGVVPKDSEDKRRKINACNKKTNPQGYRFNHARDKPIGLSSVCEVRFVSIY